MSGTEGPENHTTNADGEFEEEFEFDVDADSGVEESTLEDYPPKKKNPLPLVMGVIAGLIAIWQAYHVFMKKEALPDIQATQLATDAPVATTAITSIPVLPQASTTPSTPPPAPAASETPSAGLQEVLNSLTRIESQSRDQQQRIQFLEQSIRSVNSQLGQISQSIAGATQDLSAVEGLLQKIAKDVNTLVHPPVPAASAPQHKDPTVPPEVLNAPRLSVHAIIPGRAWLKNKEGRIITVAEGETLEPYGKVLMIDPKQGVVITSSGVAIR